MESKHIARKPKTILIAGYYGFKNTGDEAILAAMLQDLNEQINNVRFIIVSGDPHETEASHSACAIDWSDIEGIIKSIGQSDLVIMGGGGLFHDYWGFDPNSVLTSHHTGIGFYSSIALLASILDKPLILYAIGVGPLLSEMGKRYTQATVENATLISVRDTQSKEVLKSLGVPSKQIHITADPAFTLEPVVVRENIPKHLREEGPVLGVAVRNWDVGVLPAYWEAQVAEAIESFIDRHKGSVIFIPFQDKGETLLDDVGISKRIQQAMKNTDRTHVMDDVYSPAERAGLIASCDLLLGMRLHALIFAISADTPIVGMIYDPKVRILMSQADLDDFSLNLGEMTSTTLSAQLEAAYDNREYQKELLRSARKKLRNKARKNAKIIASLLEQPTNKTQVITPMTMELLKDAILNLLQKVEKSLKQIENLTHNVAGLRSDLDTQANQHRLAVEELNHATQSQKDDQLQAKADFDRAFQFQQDEHNHVTADLNEQIVQRDQAIMEITSKLELRVREHHQAITDLHEELGRQVGYRDRVIEELNLKLEIRDQKIVGFGNEIRTQQIEHGQTAQAFEARLAEKDLAIASLNTAVSDKDGLLRFFESQLADIKGSRGWKVLWGMWQVRLFFVPKSSWRELAIKKIWAGIVKTPGEFIRKALKRVYGKHKLCMSRPAFAFDIYKRTRNRSYPTDMRSLRTPQQKGLVSIVLPVYNGADLLAEAIDSILSQTYEDFELIAVNDGSQDATGEILNEFAKQDPRFIVIHQENQKLPRALNHGFALAKGEFLTWTSHDNCMKPEFLKKMVECLQRHPGWDMVYSNIDIIGEEGAPLIGSTWFGGYQHPSGSEHVYLPKDTGELNTVANNFIGGAFMYRQRVPWLIGDYSPFRYTREDYDYWLRANNLLTLRHSDFKEPLYDYRFHSSSLTHRDTELGITQNRVQLMVFDDFRRDFYLTPLLWFIDEDGSDSQIAEVSRNLKSAIAHAGHILSEQPQIESSIWPRLWVPSVYLHVTTDPTSVTPVPRNLPSNVFKVYLSVSSNNLPDTLNGEWDFCLAYGSNAPTSLHGTGRRGWVTSKDIKSLFSAIDIRARSRHLELIETEINQPSDNNFRISVIICTYQRGEKLVDTLRSVAYQTMSQKHYEVIVINNDPNDQGVADLVSMVRTDDFANRPSHLRSLICPILGLSHARNAGIAESQGEILLFLDDDSIANEDVLESYWKVYSEHNHAGVVGGHIMVFPPKSLHIPWKEGFQRYWSQFVTDHEEYTVVTNWWEYPWGANWSARREAMVRIGGFRGRYGRRGCDFSGGEEIVAASLIKKLGYSIAVLPQAKVIHQVDEDRFNLKHLKRTINAGLFAQYQAQMDLHLPFETNIGSSTRQIIGNILKLLPAIFYRNFNKKADFYEAWYYSVARVQLLGRQLGDGLRRMRRPVTQKR